MSMGAIAHEALLDQVRELPNVERAVVAVRDALDVHVTYHLAHTVSSATDDPFVRTTYPDHWIARYLLAQYVRVDPVVREGFQRILPFDWSELEVGEEAHAMMADSIAHGIGIWGYSVPVVDTGGRRALFSINANFSETDWREFISRFRDLIVEIAQIVHTIAITEVFGDQEVPNLSAREREVLIWTARGKDYKAIAIILNLSHHTVKAYMKSIRHKLNSTTMTQCVAKAIAARLIDID